MTNIPSNLMRYWRPEPKPADSASPPAAPPPRPCRWADCANHRTGALFCNKHAAAATRASDAGTLPPMDALVEMRPSQIATLTRAPKPPPAPPPPRPVAPPRVCLWPDCGRSAGRRSLCSRCKARRRRLILHTVTADVPLTPEIAATFPALWVQHCQRIHLQQRFQGWPPAPPLEIAAAPTPGTCIITGCERTNHQGRGLCCRCYNRAKYRGELERFPAKNKPRYDARLNPQEV